MTTPRTLELSSHWPGPEFTNIVAGMLGDKGFEVTLRADYIDAIAMHRSKASGCVGIGRVVVRPDKRVANLYLTSAWFGGACGHELKGIRASLPENSTEQEGYTRLATKLVAWIVKTAGTSASA